MNPVVLLHGSASSGAQWRALADHLSQHHEVLAPDLYGYGRTPSWGGRGPFRLAHESAVVLKDIECLGAPVHLVGHSYGGTVALDIARRRPELVKSLVLVEPVAFYLLRGGDEDDLAALREIQSVAAELERALCCGDYADGCFRFIDYWNGAGSWHAMSLARREALAPRLAKVVLDFHATIGEDVPLDALRGLDAGTLLIQGAQTTLPVQRICRLLQQTLPRVRFETVAGAGHMLPVTHVNAVNALILEHLHSAHLHPIQSKETRHENQDDLPVAGAGYGGLRNLAIA